MLTETDEGRGLVKVYWSDIRERVAKVEPSFASIVDELNPDDSFPIFLAYYTYGELIGDSHSPLLPKVDGGYYPLFDQNAPKDVIQHLGYGKGSLPLGMILDKNFEFFIDLKDKGISIPWSVHSPGKFISFARNLSNKGRHIYAPNGIMSTSSGSRSAFMLPNIGCIVLHSSLRRDYNVQNSPPKSLYDHWHIFKEITNSPVSECDWRSCLMYFSENWIKKLHTDKAWLRLKLYFHELAWQYFEYDRNRIYYDIAFSVIQHKRNLKPNPYLADTARHLFTTALGAALGYAPACDERSLPLKVLQKAFIESYGMKKYIPTILQPAFFNFEKDTLPVYYSLQNPTTHIFSPKSRKMSSTLFEMRELQHLMQIFSEELSKDNNLCSDTIISRIASEVQFNYFHNKPDRHRVIQSSEDIVNLDNRFNFAYPEHKIDSALFASDAKFVRGCISIKMKDE